VEFWLTNCVAQASAAAFYGFAPAFPTVEAAAAFHHKYIGKWIHD